jgi:hypothetical protein
MAAVALAAVAAKTAAAATAAAAALRQRPGSVRRRALRLRVARVLKALSPWLPLACVPPSRAATGTLTGPCSGKEREDLTGGEALEEPRAG